MKKKSILKASLFFVFLFVVVQGAISQVYIPGMHNDWDLDIDNEAQLKTNLGAVPYYGKTIHVSSDNEFKIVYNNWDLGNKWGGNYWIYNNQRYDIVNEGNPAIWKGTSSNYTHICIENPSNHTSVEAITALPVGIMTLSQLPVTVDAVSQVGTQSATDYYVYDNSIHTVNITLSAAKCAEENIYLRYTTDNWTTKNFVLATGTGTTYTATIPGQVDGTTIDYYVLTTTLTYVGGNALDISTDLMTINYNTNSGNNYTYKVAPDLQKPTACSATAISSCQNDLNWTRDGTNPDVIVVVRNGAEPDDLVQQTAYNIGDGDINTAAGLILYKGAIDYSVTAFEHIGLVENDTYHYKFFTTDGTYFSRIDASTTKSAQTNDISISLANASTITEEAENGKQINVTLTGSDFLAQQYINPANWIVDNLPIGVTKGNITITGNKTATINLIGNSQIDYDANITNVTVDINYNEMSNGCTGIANQNSGVTLTAVNETANAAISSPAITEANLNNAVITIDLTGDTFLDNILERSNFTLNNAPSGTSIEQVVYTSNTQASISLIFDQTDFDEDVTITITIDGSELTANNKLNSNGLTVTHLEETEISMSDDGSITEGSEAGEIITVTLSGHSFVSSFTPSNWTLTNMPAGISKGTITRIDDTHATIQLTGNRTSDYDINNTNTQLSITNTEIVGYGGVSITTNKGVTFTAIIEISAGEKTVKKVLLQAFWWDYVNNNYTNNWANYLTELAPRLNTIGIDAIWIPPTYKNDAPNWVGYSPFDHYDLGDKYQKGSTQVTTGIGTKDELLRMIAVMHANGIEVVQDVVLNHVDRAGVQDTEPNYSMQTAGGWKTFRYSCYETNKETPYLERKGRWSKNYTNFHPHSGHNTNGDEWSAGYWGPDFCYGYQEAGTGNGYGPATTTVPGAYNPAQYDGYNRTEARNWLMWYKKQTGVDGFRWDAVKHFPYFVVQDLSHSVKYDSDMDWAKGGESMFNVGEFVGGKSELDGYVDDVKYSNGGNEASIGTFDFSLRSAIYGVVTGNGNYDLGTIPSQQQDRRVQYYASGSGSWVHRTVPFVNNHDTFRPELDASGNYTGWKSGDELAAHIDPFDARLSLSYALIFAVDGNPQIFFEDLFNLGNTGKRFTHDPTNTTDLPVRDDLLNIIWCHQNLNFKDGAYKVRWQAQDALVIERGNKALIAINDSWSDWQHLTGVQTDFAHLTVLKDYSGANGSTTKTVDVNGKVDIDIPPCDGTANGGRRGYAIWAPEGAVGGYMPPCATETTQEWEMANDLGDSHYLSLGQGGELPDNSTNQRLAGKIYVDNGSNVTYELIPDDNTQNLTLSLYDLDGNLLDRVAGTGNLSDVYTSTFTGWIAVKANHTLTTELHQAFKVRASYTAPAIVDVTASSPSHRTAIWTGNVDTDWTNPRNWETGVMPNSTRDAIIITESDKNDPVISTTVECRNLTIQSGRTLQTTGAGDLTILQNLTNAGTLNLTGDIVIKGNLIHNGSQSGVAKVSLSGGAAIHTVSGTGALLNLELNDALHTQLASSVTIDGMLTFTAGRMLITTYNLTFGDNASIDGTFSANNMIIADNTGEVRKTYSDGTSNPGAFTFPIGDNTITAEYSPLSFDLGSSTFASAYFSAKTVDATHSETTATSNISRYWTVAQSGITGFSAIMTFNYLDADIAGDEARMKGEQWTGSLWTKYGAVNSATNNFEVSTTSTGDFTAYGLMPEITVSGKANTPIVDGDAIPSLIDGTDFGGVLVAGGLKQSVFSITNDGFGDLTILAINIGGVNAADFAIIASAFPQVIAQGSSAAFSVEFNPSAAGARSASLSITNDDVDENPYNFSITGTGKTPEIDVTQATTLIADGGSHNFGTINVASATVHRIFTIKNTGTEVLTLGSNPVSISGANAIDFAITQPTATSVAVSGSVTFSITFNPSAIGTRSASLSITNDDIDENPYNFSITGTGTIPGINVKYATAIINDNSGSHDFGNINIAGATVQHIFTIENSGTGVLTLGNNPVSISGTNAIDFAITQPIATSVAASGSVTFSVTFNPSAAGSRSASLSITNDDVGKNPYNFSIIGTGTTPEINVKQASTSIIDGTGTHNFGTINIVGATVQRIFTIENIGTEVLSLGNNPVSISGANAIDFAITQPIATSVAVSGGVTFSVTFNPSAVGVRNASLSITNDDVDENPYNFSITGSGAIPEINVKQGVALIADNTGSHNFGTINIVGATVQRIFTIENSGTAMLTLGNNPVSISGANAIDFTINQPIATSVAVSGSVTFSVTFNPSAIGARSASLSIINDDVDENPYNFSITGTGTTPEINVKQGVVLIADNTGSHNFGTVNSVGATVQRTFTIENSGAGVLTLGNNSVSISGTNAIDFSTTQPVVSVAPSGNVTFSVTFNPLAAGARTATLNIANDDVDENPYNFTITGTSTLQSEINITQNNNNIASNGSYYFGVIDRNKSSQKITFVIENTGSQSLLLNGATKIAVSGSNFIIDESLLTPIIAANGTTQFSVIFTPTTPGTHNAAITIQNTDTDENPYVINLSGASILSAPVLSADNSTSKSINLKWNNLLVDAYFIDVSKNSSFTDLVINNQNIGNVSSYIVSGLDAHTNYYCRVKAYQAGYQSPNSNVFAFKTLNSIPVVSSKAVINIDEDINYSYKIVATDADNDVLIYTKKILPTWLSLATDGTISGTPLNQHVGNHQISINISDGFDIVAHTFILTVINVNDAPTISAISKSAAEDNSILFASADFTNIFTDIDGDAIAKVQIKSLPANGTLKLGNSVIATNDEILASNLNNIIFVPYANWYGSTSFKWNASDGTVYCATDNVVNISISPVNDQPTATNTTQTINFIEDDEIVLLQDIVVTDVDENEQITVTLTATNIFVGSFTVDSGNGEIITSLFAWTITGSVGQVNAALADAKLIPVADYDENTTINVLIEDGKEDGATAINSTMQVNVTAVNDIPFSFDNDATIDEDTELTFTDNDFVFIDVDTGDKLTMIKITNIPSKGKLILINNNSSSIITNNNEIAVSEIGNLKFTPEADKSGMPYTSFQFKVGDVNEAYSAESYTFTINVNPIDDPTIAVDDTYQLTEDVMFTAGILDCIITNDIEKDGDNLIVSLVSNVQHGTLTLFRSGTFAYKPSENFNGNDSFTYQIDDGTSNSNIATVTLKVLPANDSPQAIADFYQTQEDITLVVSTGGLLDNDSDIDANDNLEAVLMVAPSNGTIQLNTDGTFTYTPNHDFYGDDKFYYAINDGNNNSVSAPVTIRVQAVNDAPVLSETITSGELNYSVLEDYKLTANLLADITDTESNTLTVKLISGTSSGKLILNSYGTFTYTSNSNVSGNDSFTFKVFDGQLYSELITVNFEVNAVNDAPIAMPETFELNEDSQLNGNILTNDTDIEKNPLTAELVTDVTNGVLAFNADGTFTYTPKANFYGDDSFAYKAMDSELYSNIVEVKITVLPVNDPPEIDLAINQTTVEYNTKSSIIGISFSDIDNEAKDVEVILSVENGIIDVTDIISQLTYCFGNKTNKITIKGDLDIINRSLSSLAWYPLSYKGNLGFVGSEILTVFISDLGNTGSGDIQTAESRFKIEVMPVAPVVTTQPQSVTLCAGESTTLSIAAQGTAQLNYQWQLDGTDIYGATSQILKLNNLTDANIGNYKCKISDHGLVAISEIAKVNVRTIELNLTKVDIACYGTETGSITAITTGVNGDLLYSLSSTFEKRLNRVSNVFEQLQKSSYTVSAKDELGCIATATATIEEPSKPLAIKFNAKAPKCNGGSDASVEALVEGGVAPYTFDWSNNETTQTLKNVASDMYSVVVTDANGCAANKEIKVNEPAAIEVKITNIQHERNAGQNSGSIQALATNGLAPYEYTFGGAIDETTQSTGLLNELNHGIYNIMATDANGCTAETKAEVTARYYKPEVNFNLTTNGLIVETTNNTRAATNYEWNFGDETIIKEEAPSHTYKEYRKYYVSLTATNDYGSKTVSKLVTLTPKTSISQTMESGLSIKAYPNPSNGKFTLSYSSNKTIGVLTVKIRNVTGQLMSTEKFSVAAKEMSKEFDINGIAPGLYFVETISENGISTQQIVIK